jgi:hypothetical protein
MGVVAMFTASFYFLGVAVFVLAASVCLSKGMRADRCVEVEIDTLRAASVCLPTGRRAAADSTTAALYKELTWDEKARWRDMKAMWMQWYRRCQENATSKQKAIYSWARTMASCALLCLVGVFLEAEFDQPVTISNVLAGFRRPDPVASGFPTSQLHPSQSTSTPATNRSPQK